MIRSVKIADQEAARVVSVTPDQIKDISRQAVVDTLTTLGFDVREPYAIQQDLAFLRTMRVGTHRGMLTLVSTIITGIVTTVGGLIWLGVNHK